jgi:hypothetical protein
MHQGIFKASWIMLLVVFIIGGIGGLLMIASPPFFMASEVQGYLGRSWSDLEAANAALFGYFMHDVRLLGFMQVAAAVIAALIVLLYYRNKDKAAWYILLACSTIALGPTLVLNIPIGDVFVILFAGVLLVASYAALGLGAAPMLAKRPAPAPSKRRVARSPSKKRR